MLMNLFGITVKDTDLVDSDQGLAVVTPSDLQKRLRRVLSTLRRAASWLGPHPGRALGLLSRALFFGFVGVAVLKRIGNWYKGMAEYEILLDRADYEYQVRVCFGRGCE